MPEKPAPPRISESEWDVMTVIWADPGATAQDVHHELAETGWTLRTVKSFLSRLVKKGALGFEPNRCYLIWYLCLCRNALSKRVRQLVRNRRDLGCKPKVLVGIGHMRLDRDYTNPPNPLSEQSSHTRQQRDERMGRERRAHGREKNPTIREPTDQSLTFSSPAR